MFDEDFMAKIISEIAEYAVANGMSPNDTIRTIADNMLFLLEVEAAIEAWNRRTDDNENRFD